MNTTQELKTQWTNPADILSILLLLGGDIVQKSIAQLVGHKISFPTHTSSGLSVAPVTFSFGWAAYAFQNLLAVVGDMRLMPAVDFPSIVVNCANGFARETQSWVLGRLLRDHEIRCDADKPSQTNGSYSKSIQIDVFNLEPVPRSPESDFLCWLGWATIATQTIIAVLPWALYDDLGVLAITLAGNLLAAITCALPQWTQEKWAAPKLKSEKVICLTRGNGHHYAMVLICAPGSWDLEKMATGRVTARPETRWISLVLALLWTCILISVSGLKEHTWFLVGIGALGMLQNAFAAGTSRRPSASMFNITRFSRAPRIIGGYQSYKDDLEDAANLEEAAQDIADIDQWASQKQAIGQHIQQSAGATVKVMPIWLASMSKEDGVPGWLEPPKPQKGREPRIRTRSWFKTEDGRSEEIIFADGGIHGALIELEKWVPTAGLAMVQTFFPAGLKYNDVSIRDNVHKKFWRRAYHTVSVRKRAEVKRRAIGRAYSSAVV
ncbi:hypothetical protein PG993_008560 [Apiospora rasikravindrae]|uniref:Uncharacterized protein n=1 Tax=Apiospora rasikravindrae TaxID=990691 RepID=A0ABR1T0P9_9PEZI